MPFARIGASNLRFPATALAFFTIILATTGTAPANFSALKKAASVIRTEIAAEDASGRDLPAAPPL